MCIVIGSEIHTKIGKVYDECSFERERRRYECIETNGHVNCVVEKFANECIIVHKIDFTQEVYRGAVEHGRVE